MVPIRGRREDTAPWLRRRVGSTVLLHDHERLYLALRDAVGEAISGVLQERKGLDSILVDEERTLLCSDLLGADDGARHGFLGRYWLRWRLGMLVVM